MARLKKNWVVIKVWQHVTAKQYAINAFHQLLIHSNINTHGLGYSYHHCIKIPIYWICALPHHSPSSPHNQSISSPIHMDLGYPCHHCIKISFYWICALPTSPFFFLATQPALIFSSALQHTFFFAISSMCLHLEALSFMSSLIYTDLGYPCCKCIEILLYWIISYVLLHHPSSPILSLLSAVNVLFQPEDIQLFKFFHLITGALPHPSSSTMIPQMYTCLLVLMPLTTLTGLPSSFLQPRNIHIF